MLIEVDLRDKDPEYYENRDFIYHSLELATRTKIDVDTRKVVKEEHEACCLVIGDLMVRMTRRQYALLIEFAAKVSSS